MKKTLLLLIFLIIPFSLADIQVKTNQDIYNLGEELETYASVKLDRDFYGLLSLSVVCRDYYFQYYLTPMHLQNELRTAVDVFPIKITNEMLGPCKVLAKVKEEKEKDFEEAESELFVVSDKLNIELKDTKSEVKPKETIPIFGKVKTGFGKYVESTIKITLDERSFIVDAINGNFNYNLEVPEDIKSGAQTVYITASDQEGNIGQTSFNIEVEVIPTEIDLNINQRRPKPGSILEVTPTLLDQASDVLNKSLKLELISPSNTKVFIKEVFSSNKLEYEISQYAEPGLYTLSSTFNDINSKKFFNISAIKEAKIDYQDQTITIENIGNVPLKDKIELFLEGSTDLTLEKKLNLDPGKIASIDLSKEVPEGIYKISYPLNKGFIKIKESLDETVQEILEGTQKRSEGKLDSDKEILVESVQISDDRSVFKKTGLSSVTGLVIGADGLLSKNPLLTTIAFILVIVSIIVYYVLKAKNSKPEKEFKES